MPIQPRDPFSEISFFKEGKEQNMISADEALKIPRYSVLAVDDEEAVRKLVARLVSRRGHQCFQATDGVDALAKAKMALFWNWGIVRL